MSASHPRNTEIIMANGAVKRIQEIRVGDSIMTADSDSAIVKKISTHIDQIWQIVPEDSSLNFTVSQNHNLSLKLIKSDSIHWDEQNYNYVVTWIEDYDLKTRTISLTLEDPDDDPFDLTEEELIIPKSEAYDRAIALLAKKRQRPSYNKRGEVISIPVKDYVKMPFEWRQMFHLYRTPLNFDYTPMTNLAPPDPYLLGYWIGDVESSYSTITINNDDILYYLTDRFRQFNLSLDRVRSNMYRINPINPADENLFYQYLNKSLLIKTRTFPAYYRFNQPSIRRAILAGFIDSNSIYDVRKRCYIMHIESESLMKSFIYLARSLGYLLSKWRKVHATINTRMGKRTGQFYNFYLYGNELDLLPVINTHNMVIYEEEGDRTAHTLTYGIKTVRQKRENCYGLITENPVQYLDGDFTVHTSHTPVDTN